MQNIDAYKKSVLGSAGSGGATAALSRAMVFAAAMSGSCGLR